MPRINFGYVCVLLIFLCGFTNGADIFLKVETTYKLNSGLHLEYVPSSSSHLYKQYVPLVYQFSVPRWNKSQTVIPGSQNCVAANYTKFFTTCPILYYLSDVHERFSEYFGHNQPLVAFLDEIHAVPETALIPADCELIQPHFENIYVDKVTIDDYLKRLTACSPLGSQEYIRGLSNYVYNISGVYAEMRRKFYNEYWLKIDLVDGRVDAAIWSNAVNVLNSLLFQNYMMESNRWKLALADCDAGKIPTTILTPSLLGDTLSDMLDTLAEQKMRPSISTSFIGNYYKASLTDCTFTNDTLIVRILVPVIPTVENVTLIKVSPMPFYYKEKDMEFKCQIDPQVLPASDSEDKNSYVLVDLNKNIAYETNCEPGKLCHISTELHPRKVNPCVMAAFNWERFPVKNESLKNDLLSHCPVKCTPLRSADKSVLETFASDQFLWFSGGGKEELVVRCWSYSSTMKQFLEHRSESIEYGSLLVEPNCNCRLTYGTHAVRSSTCNTLANYKPTAKSNVIQVTRIAPVQWYSKLFNIKNLSNVPRSLFSSPDKNSLRFSMIPSGYQMSYMNEFFENSSNNKVSAPVVLLSLATIVLTVGVVAVSWRFYKLVVQLESMGLNVRNPFLTQNSTSGFNGDPQVSYRNMVSNIDTDQLLLNEGR